MLLGAPADHLRDAMCRRRFKAGTEWVNTANTPEQAAEVRSGLAKHLYASLFSWLVETVNVSLGAPAAGGLAGPRIGCVDIFGFEDLRTNSLEQLCINFANEKLHRLFVGSMFEVAAVMYAREGVQVEPTPYTDNQPVVGLIGGKPTSLMAMLTEECIFPKGSDVLYLQKVRHPFDDPFLWHGLRARHLCRAEH
jgi:myosin heavy subunit